MQIDTNIKLLYLQLYENHGRKILKRRHLKKTYNRNRYRKIYFIIMLRHYLFQFSLVCCKDVFYNYTR